MFLLVVATLILLPLVELYVIIMVGTTIGVLPTIGLLLASSVVGGVLLRQQGARSWRALRIALAEQRQPNREVAGGALVVLGGALMVAPGFITDAVGLLLLLPPTRAAVRAVLLRYAARRAWRARSAGHQPGTGPGRVIEGEVAGPAAREGLGEGEEQ